MENIGTAAPELFGFEIYPKNAALNIRKLPGTTAAILKTVAAGALAGKSQGVYLKMTDGKWYQLKTPDSLTGYVREDVINIVKPGSITETDAKNVVNSLIESDKEVFNTLLRISPVLTVLQQKGSNTTNYEKTFKTLTDRLAARQDVIKKSTVLKWQAGLKKGYENMLTWFKNLYAKISGIGAVPIVAIVVGAVAGVGLAVSAYFIFKPKYSESQVDLKMSKDLETALAVLEPETAAKVKSELENQIDDAYNQGKSDGTFGGMFGILKPIVFAVGGFFLIKALINSQSKSK